MKALLLTLAGAAILLSSCKSIPKSDFDPRDPAEVSANVTFTSVERRSSLDPSWLKPSIKPYRMGPGDIVEIEVAQVTGTLSRTFIMPDGMVYYNLAGGVKAEGLTQSELSTALAVALSRDYVAPQVNVSLIQVKSRRYWMLGRLFKPGIYPLSQPTTLLEAISMAGGLFTSRFSGTTEELADLGSSIVLRNGKVLPVDFMALLHDGDASQNIYLQHNDYIYLPSAQSSRVLVLGSVIAPQSIGFKDSLSLVEALAKCKGPTPYAYKRSVVIVRGTMSKPRTAIINLEKIFHGEETDVELKPGDIVWIPSNPFTYSEELIDLIMQDAVSTIAVTEGASLVGSDQKPILTIPSAGGSTGTSTSAPTTTDP